MAYQQQVLSSMLWNDKICDGKCLQSENMQCPHTKRAVRNNKPIRNNKEEMINDISVKRPWPIKEAIYDNFRKFT